MVRRSLQARIVTLQNEFEVHWGKSNVLQTKAGIPLRFKNKSIAQAVLIELQQSDHNIQPSELPLVRVSIGVMETKLNRSAVEKSLESYAETDLVCYRSGQENLKLAHMQELVWGPLLTWLDENIGAKLQVTQEIVPQTQPKEAIEALREKLLDYSDEKLAALRVAAASSGSLVIALALIEGKISSNQAWEASHIDETIQMEKWGVDKDGLSAIQLKRKDFEIIAKFLRLLCDNTHE